MPRERISGDPHTTTEVVVTWTPSQHLQLGIETVDGRNLLDVLTGRPRSAQMAAESPDTSSPMRLIARAVEAVVLDYQTRQEGSHEELGNLIMDAITGNVESSTGFYLETLDRQGANRLIRTLKRARNAVYGADE